MSGVGETNNRHRNRVVRHVQVFEKLSVLVKHRGVTGPVSERVFMNN